MIVFSWFNLFIYVKKNIPNLLNIGLFPGYDYSTAQKMQIICISSMAFYPEQFSNQFSNTLDGSLPGVPVI